MKNILILGATSTIAESVAHLYAVEGNTIFLVARNSERLASLAADLKIKGAAAVHTACADLSDVDGHAALLAQVFEQLGRVDIALVAYGTLPDQNACAERVSHTLHEMNVNGLSVVSLLADLANRLEAQQQGVISVITSVAGLRGRQSNYTYGAAKGMVSTFLQGLRNRLYPAGVRVVDIKPGFVDTRMTAEFKKGALWASPESVAARIVKATDTKNATVYAPFFWRYIMMIIRSIPESIFVKLKL